MFKEKALLAETFIEEKDGQWSVFIEVLFKDSSVRYEVGRYFTKEKAQMAANYIKRCANRDIPYPNDGLGGCC